MLQLHVISLHSSHSIGTLESMNNKNNIYWVLLYSRFFSIYLTCSFSFSSHRDSVWKNTYEHILQVRKPNHREVKVLDQNRIGTARIWAQVASLQVLHSYPLCWFPKKLQEVFLECFWCFLFCDNLMGK